MSYLKWSSKVKGKKERVEIREYEFKKKYLEAMGVEKVIEFINRDGASLIND